MCLTFPSIESVVIWPGLLDVPEMRALTLIGTPPLLAESTPGQGSAR